jgi:hypothetical protein
VKFTTITLALVAVMCGAVGVSTLQRKAPGAPGAPTAAAPKAYKGPLPALPVAGYPLPRPATVVTAVYEFAARRPDVLHYIPCFCGCEQGGHVGNDDCFVKSRDAAGKPTSWEPHGMG